MPRNLATPIHTAAVGLGNLRFFRSPLDGPRMPWFAVTDLFDCLTMDRGARRVFYANLKRSYAKDVRMVWTETGEIMIAPHFMAQGLIGALTELAQAPASMEGSYAMGAGDAMKVITAGMSPVDSVNHMILAFRNENGITGDFEPVQDLGRGLIG